MDHKRLRRTEPQVDIRFLSSLGASIKRTEGECLVARSLTSREVAQHIEKLRNSVPHSQTQDWLERCEEVLRTLHTSIQHQSERLTALIGVTNQGTRPAKDALIELLGHGPILLAVPLDEDDDFRREYRQRPIQLHSPPTIVGSALHRPSLPGLLGPRGRGSRDLNSFYYKPERPDEAAPIIQLECQQWRQESETKHLQVEIYVDSELPIIEGSIECRIDAENLSSPAQEVVNVEISGQPVDITERATQLVDRTVRRARADAAQYHPGAHFRQGKPR